MMGDAPPPLPARGVPTAEQLMNRMDEIKFSQNAKRRRKKKKKPKKKKAGLKLPAAYDVKFKRGKVIIVQNTTTKLIHTIYA